MSQIKECFPSRFEEGVLLDIDFSQLEVVGLATLSMDPVLIDDLLSGRDMHRYYTAKRLGITEEEVTAKDRTFTKRMTFQLQYGSGAKNMAKKLGLPEEQCQAFIDAYYTRYAVVKQYQEQMAAAIAASRRPTGTTTKAGYPRGVGVWESPTGRTYAFLEQDAPAWKKNKDPDFSPTQMKNYAIQGFATADIMALYRARVYRRWVLEWGSLNPLCLPVNTVHDNVMFDCYNMDIALQLRDMLIEEARKLQQELWDLWAIECPVPFKIETKIGPTWANLEKVNE